jgi:hypothetical protein
MCFSANASLIAGTTLTIAGAISISQVKKPAHLFFAVIPLFFGIQQFCECVLWLSLSGHSFLQWHTPAKYTFLIFAQVIWPFWIPLSFLLIERAPKRRKILRYLLAGGIIGSLFLTYRLVFYTAVAHIDGCHIAYHIGSTKMMLWVTGILYLGAIVIAPFFSSWKRTKVLASVNLVSLILTQLFFQYYFVSVWCFFAAAQSILIVLVMREIRKSEVGIKQTARH